MPEIADKIKKIIVDQMEFQPVVPDKITLDSRLIEDLEFDELDVVDLVMAVEEEFDFVIPDIHAEKFRTMGDLVRYVEDHTHAA